MKKGLKIILCIVLVLIAGYTFAQFKLRAVLTRELSKNLKRQVYIGKVGLELPLHAYIKNFIIFEPLQAGKPLNKFVQVDKVQVSPSILPFFRGKVLLRAVYLVRPVINIAKLDAGRFNFSDMAAQAAPKTGESEIKKQAPVLLLKLRIKDGQINFVDQTIPECAIRLNLKDINFYITKLAFPIARILTRYDLKAKLQEDGLTDMASISSSGWLDFSKKDMQAEFSLNNLGLGYLQPYYKKAVSGKIESGLLNFHSNLVSQSNDLTAKCKLEVENLKISSGGTSGSAIFGVTTDSLIETLKDSRDKLSLDFELKTKFDQPRIDFAQLGNSVLGKSLEKAVLKTPRFILNIGEKTGEKDVTDALKSLGKELKKTLGK